MAHYSEMNFLFSDDNNRKTISQQLDTTNNDNSNNIFGPDINDDRNINERVVVYKGREIGTDNIKNFLKKKVYNETTTSYQNPYVKLLTDFNTPARTAGAGLKIRPADLAYLKDLGVFPINRMAILRRFPEGSFVPEDLNEMTLEPISTVIGWIPTDQNFGNISFNETWGKTNERFDTLMSKILNERFGISIDKMVPIPAFAQGLLFEFYKYAGMTEGTNEEGEEWNYKNIPVGDPNLLMEGPYRDPSSQNIQSSFQFKLETTYEQKLIGDVDPGSAMLDIIDNLYAMGTSNMKFYWGPNALDNAKRAAIGKANSPQAWWDFISSFMEDFWTAMKGIFKDALALMEKIASNVEKSTKPLSRDQQIEEIDIKLKYYDKLKDSKNSGDIKLLKDKQDWIKKLKKDKDELQKKPAEDSGTGLSPGTATIKAGEALYAFAQTILTSTVAIYRFEIRGSIELMTGGRDSSTPWYLTIGNPYAPWLASNHIIVSEAQIETSTEMGFNDQPQWLKVSFTCSLSRALGKQELMRMFNNTFRRTYSDVNALNKANFFFDNRNESTEEEIAAENKIATINGGTLKGTTIMAKNAQMRMVTKGAKQIPTSKTVSIFNPPPSGL